MKIRGKTCAPRSKAGGRTKSKPGISNSNKKNKWREIENQACIHITTHSPSVPQTNTSNTTYCQNPAREFAFFSFIVSWRPFQFLFLTCPQILQAMQRRRRALLGLGCRMSEPVMPYRALLIFKAWHRPMSIFAQSKRRMEFAMPHFVDVDYWPWRMMR